VELAIRRDPVLDAVPTVDPRPGFVAQLRQAFDGDVERVVLQQAPVAVGDLVERRAVVRAEPTPQNEVMRLVDRPRRVDLKRPEVLNDAQDRAAVVLWPFEPGTQEGRADRYSSNCVRRKGDRLCRRSVAFVALEDDRSVVPAQADVVAHCVSNRHRARRATHHV
jgi:hypothetical protein